MLNKVLLLQGPLTSVGINFFTEKIYRTPEERKQVWAGYSAAENIRALCHVFRSYGYKIVYSAWSEDCEWITQNAALFDAYCVSSQQQIASTVEFLGRSIQNNKEKLYRSIYTGLQQTQDKFGDDCLVVRLRSDLAVDVREVERSITLAAYYKKSFHVEYIDKTNILYVPDFITISPLDLKLNLYKNLVALCETNQSYHISSHIDHGMELLNLKEKGCLEKVVCMTKALHDSMVWRGIPRYMGDIGNAAQSNLAFDCQVNYPNEMTVNKLIDAIHPELSGKR